jgi:F0F1-type ATP synthase membrane subunit b/b'
MSVWEENAAKRPSTMSDTSRDLKSVEMKIERGQRRLEGLNQQIEDAELFIQEAKRDAASIIDRANGQASNSLADAKVRGDRIVAEAEEKLAQAERTLREAREAAISFLTARLAEWRKETRDHANKFADNVERDLHKHLGFGGE